MGILYWDFNTPVIKSLELIGLLCNIAILLFPLFALNETFIKRTPLLSGRGHLKST